MIILTQEEAEKVRGISPINGQAALDPIPLKDGTFMLGEEVLDDPAHADVKAFLAALPKAAVAKANRYVITLDPVKDAGDIAEIEAKAIPDWKTVGPRKGL